MENWKKILFRAAGFGAGFAAVAAVIVGGVFWWSCRPPKPKPWDGEAITAKIGELTLGTAGDHFHFVFHYALKNNTPNNYTLPSTGSLMRKLSDTNSIEKVTNASWDETIIPAHEAVSVAFTVDYNLADYNTTSDELNKSNGDEVSKALAAFADRRLKEENDGFVFLDYGAQYRIELPQNWKKK